MASLNTGKREVIEWVCQNFSKGSTASSLYGCGLRLAIEEIDNAPTVPLPDFKEGYRQAIIDGKTNYSRTQGELPCE